MVKNFCCILVISVFFFACKKKCTIEDTNFTAPANEVQLVEDYLAGSNTTATKHPSGLYYHITTPGTGNPIPDLCANVQVAYTGRLTNGDIFDQSVNPVTFSLGSLIVGWRKGIPLIKKGGSIRLYVPPSMGYGPNPVRDAVGDIAIPGNSILVFDVELVNY